MILSNHFWYDILPSDYNIRPNNGKWLYFAEKRTIHSWLFQLDYLVDNGLLRAAKVSRKDPQYDPFPHKPCVLCAFTSDDEMEKQQVKDLLLSRFGIEVTVWKSNAQTREDWKENGWLNIEAEIADIKKQLSRADLSVKPSAALRKDLLRMLDRLERSIQTMNDPDRTEEIRVSKTGSFIKDLRSRLSQDDITLRMILDKLDKIQGNGSLASLDE